MADRQLLGDDDLHASAVVANYSMNRERQLTGVNSYARELGFDPLDAPRAAIAGAGRRRLAGPAPREWPGARRGGDRVNPARYDLVGIDLVGAVDLRPAPVLIEDSVTTWTPDRRFDLITCVHGLHYVGDKLAALARASGWLTPSGLLVADLDVASVPLDGRRASRRLSRALRTPGSTMTSGATGSPAPAPPRSACPTGTSAPMTTPAPTTPANPPSTPTTSENRA